MNKKGILWTSSLLLTLSALATGCGSTATSQNATSQSKTSQGTTTSTSASNDKELVFYSAEGFDKDIAEAFQKKTGIQVKLVDDSTGPLLAKMQAEKNNPQWDVAWFDGAPSMQGLDNQGMLYKDYTPAGTQNYNDLGKQLAPSDHSYFPVSVTAAAAIGYNTKLMKEADLPQDWSDLLKPQYKGQIAMNNPSISGPTYSAVAGLMSLQGGIPQGEDFFSKLKANGLQVFDSNGPTITNLTQGNVKMVLAQDSALIDKMKKGAPIKIIYPKSGVTMLSSNIAIDAKAPHLQAAKEFLDFVTSVEGQQIMAKSDDGDANYESIFTNGPQKTGIRPDGIKWNTLDTTYAAQNENDLKQWFTQNVVQ